MNITIDLESLPPTLLDPAEPSATSRIPPGGMDLEAQVNDYERGLLLDALEAAGGVKKRAAQLLGISFRSYRYRLEKLGLDNPHSD